MIDAGLCTRGQYDASYDELIDCMAQHFEDKTSNHIARTFDQGPVKTNQWDSADLAEIDNTPRAKAENEYKQYLAFMKCKYLPEMKSLWNLLFMTMVANQESLFILLDPLCREGKIIQQGKIVLIILIKMAAKTL